TMGAAPPVHRVARLADAGRRGAEPAAALVVHRHAGPAVEHASDRGAGGAVGPPRSLSLAAPSELCCGGGRRVRATPGAHRVADCGRFHAGQRVAAGSAAKGGERRVGLHMTTYDADLLIVGGGPGGLATALQARRHGLSVIVAEPRDGPIDKACG